MKRALMIITVALSVVLAILAGYCMYNWYSFGSITVSVPQDVQGADIFIEGDFVEAKVVSDYILSLGYGRYDIRVPKYEIKCTIHKNCHGHAIIEVTGKNQYTVKCDWNAWLVTDDPKFKSGERRFGRWREYRFP